MSGAGNGNQPARKPRASLLEPERYFARVSRIDIDADLLGAGYSCALLDIDNTVRSRATHDVPRDVRFWLSRARDKGVSLCLLSNNFHRDVYDFARDLDMPVVAKAMKPLPACFFLALSKMGSTHDETVVIGDQLSTDVVGAHLAGLSAYLVAPLAEQDLKHTLYVRRIEARILGNRQPEGAHAAEGLDVPDTRKEGALS